ncbi:DUF1329 domain-containing protein [Amphritea sp. HPY]|uniref:DUF1329 domain-containing protein n=1 Tax=Amphritea sp. HPY TaxID=3421652 RepID=UPI003D7C6D5B
MKITKALLLTGAASLALSASSLTLAQVSAEEAAKLGAELTPYGAERAGNADGSIPEWTGGLKQTPAGYQAGGLRPDPYASDTVQMTITGANYKDYADKLTEGAKAMFEKYPDTFQMPVYQTRRSFAAPQWIYDNVAKNATSASLSTDGNGIDNAAGGIPFPIAKTGAEVVWNHNLRWAGKGTYKEFSSYTVFDNGQINLGGGLAWESFPYYKKSEPSKADDIYFQLLVQYAQPTRRKGEVILLRDPMNQSDNPRQAWQYIPGQRRVRRAPTVAFDTPNAQFSGQATYDDAYMFNGSPERYNWTLIGKQEMYIPYNNYKFINEAASGPEAFATPNFPNPDLERWELHRVWVVEGELKDGKRHIYGKRRFYFDEDSWLMVANDAFDGRGELWRAGFAHVAHLYDQDTTVLRGYWLADMLNGAYAVNEVDNKPLELTEGKEAKFFTPQSVRKLSRR